MKLRSLVIAAPLFALLSLAACGSSTSGSNSLFCSQNMAGSESCVAYKGFTSDQQSTLNSECTSASGSVVSSCPSAGLLGCCTTSVSGYSVEECYYGGDSGVGLSASQEESSCTMGSGTWSTGQ
jgi:hypothetical protein